MDVLAFLSLAAVARKPEVVEGPPAKPDFAPRWWYRADRLDARPVIWSIKNRPEEWQAINSYDGCEVKRRADFWAFGYMLHVPSQHKFYIRSGEMARLSSAPGMELDGDCGCFTASRGRLQPFHSLMLKSAAQGWFRQKFPEPVLDHSHFQSHFIR